MPMPTLRHVLKERTASAHATLERLPLMRALSEGRLGPAEYGHYLQRQRQLQLPLEAALRPWASPAWHPLRLVKASWLDADLRALGATADAGQAAVPEVASYPQALGVLYVLEGSTLGFQVVLKRLSADHLAHSTAGAFLHGYGPQTGSLWRCFLDELAELPPVSWPEAAAAAVATFAAYQQHFSEACNGR